MITELEKSLLEVDHNKEVKTYFSIIGKSLGLPGSVQQIQGQHIGAMVLELVSSDSRLTDVSDLIIRWKKNINKLAGLESMTISSKRQGPPGKDIDIRIIPNNINNDISYTKLVADEVKSLLSKYEEVSDIYDDLPWGLSLIHI